MIEIDQEALKRKIVSFFREKYINMEPGEEIRIVQKRSMWGDDSDSFLFAPFQFADILKKAGFSDVDAGSSDMEPFYISATKKNTTSMIGDEFEV
jgi:hypothetical protein